MDIDGSFAGNLTTFDRNILTKKNKIEKKKRERKDTHQKSNKKEAIRSVDKRYTTKVTNGNKKVLNDDRTRYLYLFQLEIDLMLIVSKKE